MDKSIVITGGGAGIGRAVALPFHGLGWRVAALDVDAEALAELAELLPKDRCLTIRCDVGKEAQVKRAFGRIGRWLSAAPLSCLVNNAGSPIRIAGRSKSWRLPSGSGGSTPV